MIYSSNYGEFLPSYGELKLILHQHFCKMNKKVYEYDAVIQSADIGSGGAYVPFPYDIRVEFGKGRVKVHATFDSIPYDGSVVNMGVKNVDGSVCYIIGILKDIRKLIRKQPGDTVHVIIEEKD